MQREKAKSLVENLLDRLVSVEGRYELPGGVLSVKERDALATLAGLPTVVDIITAPPVLSAAAGPAIITERLHLSDDCLGHIAEDAHLLCVDFGTAFSKAAVWLDGDDAPTPLDLGAAVGGTGLTEPSTAFINDGYIFFGSEASRRFAVEGNPERQMFSSPKEYLTHDHVRFQTHRPLASVDPTGQFRSRDLLALYLGYLTYLSIDRLERLGVSRHAARRFAAPGWGDAQISRATPHFEVVAAQLKLLLIDAQILADTFSPVEWRDGLEVGRARSALNELALITAERRESAIFVERSVLEAVAAATGIQDKLVNRRPQVLVVDVGAGTTDIGLFKYSVIENGARVSAYRDGMRAMRMAGNRLDDALVELAWSRLSLASDSQLKSAHTHHLRQSIRDYKRDLFSDDGSIRIDVDGFESVVIDQEEFERTPAVRHFAATFEEQIKSAMNGAGIGSRNFLRSNEPNVAVFTGGGGSLPFLRRIVEKPIVLDEGTAYFRIEDPIPDWVAEVGGDVERSFAQLAVSTGGCSPYLPDEKGSVSDTTQAASRSLGPNYKS